MPVMVMFACNDWRNGHFLGRSESVEMFDCELTSCGPGSGVKVWHEQKKVKGSNLPDGDETLHFGRLVLPCLKYSTWVGNWCWDAATVRVIHAVSIWNYLIEGVPKQKWRCEDGPTELFEIFNRREKLDPKKAPEILTRSLAR